MTLLPNRRTVLTTAAAGLAFPNVLRAQTADKTSLRIGHINDVSALPLFVAQARDAFKDNGLKVRLRPSRTHTEIEDALFKGKLDAAIMPYARPLVSVFKQSGLSRNQMVIPTVTMMGGGALCVTTEFYDRLVDADKEAMIAARPTSAQGIAALLASTNRGTTPRLRFGVTQRNSMEEFLLRYWLAASGINPEQDVEFVAQTGPFLVASLRARAIDGFFAIEPWTAHAVSAGYGRSLVTAQEIWGNAPMAGLVVNLGWLEQNPNSLSALIRSLIEAGNWIDSIENRDRAIKILSRESTLNLPTELGLTVLSDGYRYIKELGVEPFPDYAVFHRYVSHYPWLSDALWHLTQMTRWGQLKEPVDLRRIAQGVIRPDLYRNAVIETDEPLPRQEYRVEGTYFAAHIVEDATQQFILGPDAFIDGSSFNPARLTEYITSFDVSTPAVDMASFSELNG